MEKMTVQYFCKLKINKTYVYVHTFINIYTYECRKWMKVRFKKNVVVTEVAVVVGNDESKISAVLFGRLAKMRTVGVAKYKENVYKMSLNN